MITFITGVSYGSLHAIKQKAGRYFAGHASVTGFRMGVPQISDPETVIASLKESKLPIRLIAPRTSYNNNDAVIFFNGETIRQRKLVGIDFEREGPAFNGLDFVEGGWNSLSTPEGRDGILISISAAKLLKCRVGDRIVLYVTTETGQYNTANLIVRGIFDETSIFGYIAYMRRDDLNTILSREREATTDIAVYANEGINLERFAENVRLALAEHFKVYPSFASREERDAKLLSEVSKEETFAVLSQNAQLAQVKQLIDALLGITYFVMSIFIAIVMVGILNTYRVLVYERTKEIGVMRALGMERFRVRALFLGEAGLLALFSSVIGLAIGISILAIMTLFDLSSVPASGLFLEGRHLRFFIDTTMVGFNFLIMLVAAVLAAWSPAKKASRTSPAEAMRR